MVAPVAPWIEDTTTGITPSSDSGAVAANGRRRHVASILLAIVILAIGVAFLVHSWLTSRAVAGGSAPPGSVAVLPFLDLMTEEMNEEYFADGMTEELIGDLSKYAGLRVPAPTASFYFKGKQRAIADIARQLGVAYVLDEAGDCRNHINKQMVAITDVTDESDSAELRELIERHWQNTRSSNARRLLDAWEISVTKFLKILPKDYQRVLACIRKAHDQGLTGDEAIMAAFEENAHDLARVGGN